MFDVQSKNSKVQGFERDFDVDSSKSEKKSPNKSMVQEPEKRKALDDQEVGKVNRKKLLFDMTKEKESKEPLSAAVFEY